MTYWMIPAAEVAGALPVWLWIVLRGRRRVRRIHRTGHR